MMDKIEIREVKNTDFDTIFVFINELENQKFDVNRQREIFTENLANPYNIYLLATIDTKPVGFLSCHIQHLLHHRGLVGEIQEMYIRPESRNLGIGHKLVDKLKRIARDQRVIQLEVTSDIKRELAHKFYKNQQFIDTHKKFVYLLTE